MEDGMRLKVEGPMVLHANKPRNIHDNGLDREFNCNTDTTNKFTTTGVIDSAQWTNEYNGTKSLGVNDNYKVSSLRFLRPPSPANSLADDEEGQHSSGVSSSDASPEAEDYRSLSQSSDTESEGHRPRRGRGIVNPNYPGFQHFASQLHSPGSPSDSEDDTTSLNNIINNNNNNIEDKEQVSSETLNHLNSAGSEKTKTFYEKPKLNIPEEDLNFNDSVETVTKLVNELDIPGDTPSKSVDGFDMVDTGTILDVIKPDKMADAFLSGVKEEIQKCEDTNRVVEKAENVEKVEKEEKAVIETDPVVPRKKEKIEVNLNVKKVRSQPANVAAHQPPANMPRPFGPARRTSKEKKRNSPEALGSFDVYNIETAMPTIDLDAIENHLKAAREEERRRRNDREEIRRRLATGCDADEYYGGDRPGRKPSLQARLQSGMNLQICFMNDTMSDTESPSSDSETPAKAVSPIKQPSPLAAVPDSKTAPPANANLKSPRGGLSMPVNELLTEADFFACQARLQSEARLALAQAKDMAHLQMEVERQRKQISPITEMLRATLLKVGVVFPEDRRRVSRQMLTDMNVAQLQVIVNDLHTQIEYLNESLVKFLMDRDDLHMGQDSMLVDIEDLTRYLGAKENTFKEDISFNNNIPATKPKNHRIGGLVRK